MDEPGQLELTHYPPLAHTVVGRATGSSQIVGEALVNAVTGSLLTVRNPATVMFPLTITPDAGATRPPAPR